MRLVLAPLIAIAFLAVAALTPIKSRSAHTLVIVGGTEGYLSPCGCTDPMSGGIRRRTTLLRSLVAQGEATVLDNGPLIGGIGRQDQIKAETLAETMALFKPTVASLGLEEAMLGPGFSETLERLSGSRFLASSLEADREPFAVSGPFVIGTYEPRSDKFALATRSTLRDESATLNGLLERAEQERLTPVLLLRGDEQTAKRIAQKYPALRLIVCVRQGSPFVSPLKVGRTLIVSPGEHGKFVVKIQWDGKRFIGYRWYVLGPEYADDSAAQEIYANYLSRVAHENLLAMVPRSSSEDFAGSGACATCHAAETEVWKRSAHSKALATLERDGHDRDPDCVKCHVVGLESVGGFVSRVDTPMLADVGCESCHGPAKAHAMEPSVKLNVKANESCGTCHDTSHSPAFRYDDYWPRIAH